MADMSLRDSVILSKIEANYGVDSTPGAIDVVLCSIPDHGVDANKRERNYARASMSLLPVGLGYKKQTIKFSCELKGPNDALLPATPTYLEPLLQSCGLVAADGVIGADEARTYNPTSTQASIKSCTIYYFLDGIKHALVGCRGNATLEFAVDGFAQINFEMTGFYVSPAAVANPVVVLPSYLPPAVLNCGFSIGAYNPTGIEKITLSLGNKIVEKKDLQSATGLSAVIITGREPKVTMDCDMDTLANFDPYNVWETGTLKALDWMFGAKGNRVAVECPTAQMEAPSKADREGRAIWNLSMLLTGNDDDYVIKTG